MADIRGITGGIGAGKTYIVVREIKKLRDNPDTADREIFTNIRGIDESLNCQPLPDPWHSAPQNALIIIDEIQDLDCFTRAYSNKMHVDALPLAKIRHKNHDVWFTTQSWKPISTFVQGLVNDHWHIIASGEKKSRCYRWKEAQIRITKATKQQAYFDEVYALDPKIHALYKSVEDGAKVSRSYHVNMNLISFLVGLAIILAIGFGVAWATGNYAKGETDKLGGEKNEQTENNDKQDINVLDKNSVSSDQLSKEVDEKIRTCQEQFQWTFEQCRGVYDKEYTEARNQELQQSTGNNIDQVVEDYYKYNPSKPYDVAFENEMKPSVYPKFSGCAKYGTRYVAYTQQGTILNDVSSSDCRRLIDNNDRPFDYFREKEQSAPYQYASNVEVEPKVVTDPKVLDENLPFGYKAPNMITQANSM